MADKLIGERVRHIISGIAMMVVGETDPKDTELGLMLYHCRWVDTAWRVQEYEFYIFELKINEK